MTLGTARVIQGDATHLPLADSSVDLVITSPPYFGLRSYQDGGQHYDGQFGDEPTPREYVDNLITATREMIRVLKPTGSIWVNLGDKYASGDGSGNQSSLAGGTPATRANGHARIRRDHGVPTKSLIGIPWRYALRAIDDLNLILRAEIIWNKPNGLPESVTDRVRRSHEVWFHFTKEPRYYSAVDHIREPHTAPGRTPGANAMSGRNLNIARTATGAWDEPNPLGKLPGSVWTIPTQPLTIPDWLGVDHYAAFPIEWPRRIIAGWSPPGICTNCGQGRRPVRGTTCDECGGFRPNNAKECPDCGHRRDWKTGRVADTAFGVTDWSTAGHGTPRHPGGHVNRSVIADEACDCPTPTAPTTPATVLDPFGGTGTVALAAKAAGRHGITLDMSADYNRIATWRCSDPAQLAAALHVDKPPVQHDGQLDLLDGLLDTTPPAPTRPRGGIAYANAHGRACTGCGYRSQYATAPQCEKCGTTIERTG